VPAPGWNFVRWNSGTDFLCSDSTNPTCVVSNVGTAGNAGIEAIVASDKVYYVMPVFEPEPDLSGCGQMPGGVTLTAAINWASPGSQTLLDLGPTGILSTPFQTTSGNSYAGQVSITATVGTGSVTRQVWFSLCPGGQPLDRGSCEALGTSSATLRWKQVEPGIPWESNKCNLRTVSNYYLNIRNLDCENGTGCDVFRNLYTNNMPY
jgi:hypothetical protein